MKVFDKNEKVNFIDENNVFVGYDTSQDCCEHADWFFALQPQASDIPNDVDEHADVSKYYFDGSYVNNDIVDHSLDEGGIVAFRMVAKGMPDIFLHLFNSHNGYYGHGFEFKLGDETIDAGLL
jgi:hypothetical protein